MLLADLRYTFRLMRRSPGFTAIAILSLGLGIGANTAIFSLLYTVMLRTLPVSHPEQLVEIMQTYPGEPRGHGLWSWEEYIHFRDHSRSFSALTGASFDKLLRVQAVGEEAETRIGEYVPRNYFETLGLKPAIGRLIGRQDVPAAGEGSVAVLSWSYWDRRFHRDPSVLGRRLILGNNAVTIIGVGPRGYSGPLVGMETDLWLPREHNAIQILARLKPGVMLQQARAEAAVLFRPLLEAKISRSRDSKVRGYTVEVEPAAAGFSRVRDMYGKPLLLLMAVVGLLLALACINTSSMLLARGATRRPEIAVRVGLGASPGRLLRQMLTESILLSVLGAVLGVVLAYFTTGALGRILSSGRAHERIVLHVQPDLRLVLLTASVAILAGTLFGLAPAWYALRTASGGILRESGRAGSTRFWRRFGEGLVAAQVALSVLLVAGAGVFLAHVARLRHLDLGFRSDHVLLLRLDPAGNGYRRAQLVHPYQELLARLESIPSVRSATISACTPIEGCGASQFVLAEGFAELPEDRRYTALNWIAPRYFETLGIPLLQGRDFTLADAGRSRVAIISQAMARYYFPGMNPIGKHLVIDRNGQTGGWYGDNSPYEIVGVVSDAKYSELREEPPRTMYMNMFQEDRIGYRFALRTTGTPEAVAGDAGRVVREILKTIPVMNVTTLSEQVDAAIVPERLIATLSGYFGVLAVALASIGLYGLLTYTVSRRTNEIGIRMALGATPSGIARLVLSHALAMSGAGLVAGAALIAWMRPFASMLLPDLEAPTVGPIAAATAAIIAIAFLASYIPARRAARVDPMEALRHE